MNLPFDPTSFDGLALPPLSEETLTLAQSAWMLICHETPSIARDGSIIRTRQFERSHFGNLLAIMDLLRGQSRAEQDQTILEHKAKLAPFRQQPQPVKKVAGVDVSDLDIDL